MTERTPPDPADDGLSESDLLDSPYLQARAWLDEYYPKYPESA